MHSTSLLAAAALLLAPSAQAAYTLKSNHTGATFFEGFNFYGDYDNSTNGDVFFVNQSDSSDLAYYQESSDSVFIKVDTANITYPNKRRSVKFLSEESYGIGSLVVFDALHVPYGCSVWPAMWLVSDKWPDGGEIDVFEGVNLQATNQMALHTTSGCNATNSTSANPYTGQLLYNDCDSGVNANSGCGNLDASTASYGAHFAKAGGGLWAVDFGKDAINIYFFSRANIPSDLLYTNASAVPNPANWGTPSGSYLNSSCSITDHFAPLRIVVDITLCGDWAGNSAVLSSTGCPLQGSDTCYTRYVQNSTIMETAYFEMRSLRAYTDEDRAANSSQRAYGITATTLGSLPTGTGTTGRTSASPVSSATILQIQAFTALFGAFAVGAWAIL